MRHNKGLENWACDRSTDEADLPEYVETARHGSGNMDLRGSLGVEIYARVAYLSGRLHEIGADTCGFPWDLVLPIHIITERNVQKFR